MCDKYARIIGVIDHESIWIIILYLNCRNSTWIVVHNLPELLWNNIEITQEIYFNCWKKKHMDQTSMIKILPKNIWIGQQVPPTSYLTTSKHLYVPLLFWFPWNGVWPPYTWLYYEGYSKKLLKHSRHSAKKKHNTISLN